MILFNNNNNNNVDNCALVVLSFFEKKFVMANTVYVCVILREGEK